MKKNDTILWQRLTKAAIQTADCMSQHTHTKHSKHTHRDKDTHGERELLHISEAIHAQKTQNTNSLL